MKHKSTNSASSGELDCPHLRDHPTRRRKPKRINRGRNVVCSDQHLGTTSKPYDRSNSSTGELRSRSAQALADAICPFRLQAALVPIKNHLIIDHKCHSTGEGVRYSTSLSFYTPVAVPPSFPFACFVYFLVKQVPNHEHFPCDFPTRNQFPKLNLASRSCLISSPVARAARTEDQDEGMRSFHIPLPLSTLNPEIPQRIRARSACSAYPFGKIRNTIQPLAVRLQTSLPPAETIAEIVLRFPETSQQTLRHFSLLQPLTTILLRKTVKL
jgi:hypothetical protein